MKANKFHEFHKKGQEERLRLIKEYCNLNEEDIETLKKTTCFLGFDLANRMSENVIGVFSLPYSIATNFVINGKERLIPMVIEEPSVVAAVSKAAKLAENFSAKASEQIMFGQIHLCGIKNIAKAKKLILKEKKRLIEIANSKDPVLVSKKGGANDIKLRVLEIGREKIIIVHLIVDVKDAMGANAVNTMCEAVGSELENITKGEAIIRILTNLCIARITHAKALWKKEVIGKENVDKIIKAYKIASNDIFRAVTNNKGIMNGVDAVLIATGNDFRAVEAACHSYASLTGRYRPLIKYYKNKNCDLIAEAKLPLAVGVVGGATNNPIARLSLKILNINSAKELCEIIASVALAQNFAALYAIVSEGIQKGHMRLHSKNIAMMAGAKEDEVDIVAERMIRENKIRIDKAKEILEELRA